MIRPTALLRAGVVAAAVLALGGCISLFPKSKPAQLYRFGLPMSEAAAPAPTQGAVGVFRANSMFQRETAGDRILAIVDGQAQYIAQSRWVAPASVLWDQAVLSAFDTAPGRVRLVSRGELAPTQYTLRLDVRTFETHFDAGPDAAPTVVVRVRGTLTQGREPEAVSERIFTVSQPAGSSHVSSIVDAYDAAVAKLLGEVVDWTEAQVAGAS